MKIKTWGYCRVSTEKQNIEDIDDKTYEEDIIKGVYENIEYENKALLLVGANPTLSPNHEKLNLLRLQNQVLK